MKAESSQLQAAALDALAALREAFPLQQRIEKSPARVQAAYARILNHWRAGASAPPVNIIDAETCAILVDLDAVVVQEKGLGCYPFSADNKGFSVHCTEGSGSVNAFCAIDALAIPHLLGHRARVESRCTFCNGALHVEVNADGTLPEQPGEHIKVAWIPGDQTGSQETCCNRVCPNINFVCITCIDSGKVAEFTLPQASIIGNSFFSFQK